MTIQNGDACPDGTLRGITVKFTCDSRSVGPQTFTTLETTTYVCGCINVCGGVRGQMLVLRRVGWMLRCARKDRGLQFQHRAALRSQQPSRTAAACTYTRTSLLPTLSSLTSEIQCVLSSPPHPLLSSPPSPLSLVSLSRRCQYEWDFPTYTACGEQPPAPGPLGPGGGIQDLSLRNFGCGHISCGWMFLILIPLVALVAFGIALPLNKFVLKKDSTWIEAIPLSTLGPLFLDYVRWGGLFLIFNWPCLTQVCIYLFHWIV